MTKHNPNHPKIRGFVATRKNKIIFLYRKKNRITFLVSLDYQEGNASLEIGSRFYGRIYPNRCDLSPDGKWFIYFAMGQSQSQYDKKLHCWTGICSPPNINAQILFIHDDTWGGGGRFVDDQTIYISPGLAPRFDLHQKFRFGQYQITFEGKREDGGWASGTGWELVETQIDPQAGDKAPRPARWIKTNGKTTLLRHLNYSFGMKTKTARPIGEYDLYDYEIMDNQTQLSYSLNQEAQVCHWADYDRFGRLVLSRESEVLIYQNLDAVLKKKAVTSFDLEKLTT